jgi:hypothetical protein
MENKIKELLNEVKNLLSESKKRSGEASCGYDEGWYNGEVNAYEIVINQIETILNEKKGKKNQMKFYAVSLCYYTEENVPECGAMIIVKTDREDAPTAVKLRENDDIHEFMTIYDCEGIGSIVEISEEDMEFYDDADVIEL